MARYWAGMSAENVEIMRRSNAAFNRRDGDAAFAEFAHGRIVRATVGYAGRAQALKAAGLEG